MAVKGAARGKHCIMLLRALGFRFGHLCRDEPAVLQRSGDHQVIDASCFTSECQPLQVKLISMACWMELEVLQPTMSLRIWGEGDLENILVINFWNCTIVSETALPHCNYICSIWEIPWIVFVAWFLNVHEEQMRLYYCCNWEKLGQVLLISCHRTLSKLIFYGKVQEEE